MGGEARLNIKGKADNTGSWAFCLKGKLYGAKRIDGTTIHQNTLKKIISFLFCNIGNHELCLKAWIISLINTVGFVNVSFNTGKAQH